jgi:hypothetical protein
MTSRTPAGIAWVANGMTAGASIEPSCQVSRTSSRTNNGLPPVLLETAPTTSGTGSPPVVMAM